MIPWNWGAKRDYPSSCSVCIISLIIYKFVVEFVSLVFVQKSSKEFRMKRDKKTGRCRFGIIGTHLIYRPKQVKRYDRLGLHAGKFTGKNRSGKNG